MSQARDTFYQLLSDTITDKSYALKKSSGNYEKTIGDVKYIIQFSWDGRAGTTYINGLIGIVQAHKIAKITKNMLAYEIPVTILQPQKSSFANEYPIPQMYSSKLIELVNQMNFKQMSALSFEEKYPMQNILRTVKSVADFIHNEVIPFHNLYNSENQIMLKYIKLAKEKVDKKEYFNSFYYIVPIKIMCKKMNIQEPDFMKDINVFTNQSIDELWNIQDHDFHNLEQKFNNI